MSQEVTLVSESTSKPYDSIHLSDTGADLEDNFYYWVEFYDDTTDTVRDTIYLYTTDWDSQGDDVGYSTLEVTDISANEPNTDLLSFDTFWVTIEDDTTTYNDIKLWLQYKDASGTWQDCGVMKANSLYDMEDLQTGSYHEWVKGHQYAPRNDCHSTGFHTLRWRFMSGGTVIWTGSEWLTGHGS